jgi:bifunctional ADP-heptose synthase (sugar kinase/adenylyltransferase)
VDEQEMLLACGLRDPDFKQELAAIKSAFQAQYCWLTRGAKYTLGLNGVAAATAPSLQKNVTDTIGAGDALFSVVTLAARSGIPIDLSTFIGQLAGAQAVDTIGNTQPVNKTKLIKGGMALLNY